MSRFRLALLAVGALTVCAAAVTTWRFRQARRSPLDSLQRLADADRAQDRPAIERYLDVRRVAESVVDEAIAAATAQAGAESSGQDEADAWGSALGLGAAESMKPSLVTSYEQSLWSVLTDSSATVPDGPVQDIAGKPLDPRVMIQRYQGIADVQQRDSVARVGVRLRVEDVDSGVVVHLRMERADGHWRVVGVADLGPYMRASLARRLDRAHELEMRSDLRNLVTAQAMYFADHATYAPSLRALGYVTTAGVSVEIVQANGGGWRAVARHQSTRAECHIAMGTAMPAGDVHGQPKCLRRP